MLGWFHSLIDRLNRSAYERAAGASASATPYRPQEQWAPGILRHVDRDPDNDDFGKDGDPVEVACDCGAVHPGTVTGGGSRLCWYCPDDGEWLEDVNA